MIQPTNDQQAREDVRALQHGLEQDLQQHGLQQQSPTESTLQASRSRMTRRAFLSTLALGAAAVAVPKFFTERGAYAEALTRTPSQTEGPFYPFPDYLPLDTDNDLLRINDAITPAVGKVTHLGGRVLDANGNPLSKMRVEIWQVDHNGVYIYGEEGERPERDKNFQGFGRFETGKSGEYRFRTVKPVAYPGRTPHIHFKVWQGERQVLTSQLYIKGDPRNARDGVYRGIHSVAARELVTVNFVPLPNSKTGELVAKMDIILGITPPE